LVKEGAEAEGTKCVTCGWIGTAGPVNCPVDETRLDRVDNIVEPAIQAAIQQSADVHVLEAPEAAPSERVEPFPGPLAAVLRY
jgi:peptide subunit release factor 1 (eRF1)